MIVDRIRQIIEYKEISTRQFCLKIGVANGFLDKVKDVGSEKVAKILYAFPEINPEWLLMGEGSMLRSPQANRTGHVVVSNDFKGGTNHIGDISISNGIEAPPLGAKEGQDAGDQSIRDRQHLIAEIERLKSILKTQESMIEWLKQKYDEEAAHNRSLVNELLGKNKA
mgnify:FL=1